MAIVSARGATAASTGILTGADLQAAIDSLSLSEYGGIIQLPPGTITLRQPITITDTRAIRIVGSSMGGSKIRWLGSNTHIFQYNGTQNCELSNMYFQVDNAAQSIAHITDNGTDSAVRSSGFTARHVYVDGGEGLLNTVFWVALTADGGKNDHHTFDTCQAQEYSFAFARLEGQASVNNRFLGCRAQSRDYGDYGIYAKHDTDINEGGQYQVEGGIWMEHNIADFYSNTRLGTNLIHKVFGEQSARHLIVEDGGSAYSGVNHIIRDCRFTVPSSKLPADEEIVQVYTGALTIDGNTFGATAANMNFKFRFEPNANRRGGFAFTNNTLMTSLTSGHFPATAPDTTVGSWRRTGSSPTVAM